MTSPHGRPRCVAVSVRAREPEIISTVYLPPTTTSDHERQEVFGGVAEVSLHVIVGNSHRWQPFAGLDRDSQGYWFESSRRSSDLRLYWFHDREMKIRYCLWGAFNRAAIMLPVTDSSCRVWPELR